MAERDRSRSRERSFPAEEEGTKLYVGNLSYQVLPASFCVEVAPSNSRFVLKQTTNEDLESAFSKYGSVNSAQVIMDRDTGRSR